MPGLLAGCSFASLPTEPPPLFDMEEPLPLQKEPDDEAVRVRLSAGSFSGIHVKSAWFEEPDEPVERGQRAPQIMSHGADEVLGARIEACWAHWGITLVCQRRGGSTRGDFQRSIIPRVKLPRTRSEPAVRR